MAYSFTIAPDHIGIGETISIHFKNSSDQNWDKLEVQFWGVIHQKLRLWPKPEAAIYLTAITKVDYELKIKLPDQPFFAYGIVQYLGPCQVKILAHQASEKILLVEKQIFIGESKNPCQTDFPEIIPNPVKLFFEGEAYRIFNKKDKPNCRVIVKQDHFEKDWAPFLQEFNLSHQNQPDLQINIDINAHFSNSLNEVNNRKECYSLTTVLDDSNPLLKIYIQATTTIGVKHAFRTLQQLISYHENSIEIPLVEIFDYPQFNHRGVIEGFYGTPWSQKERLDMIQFLGSVKCNSYIYAPKDDPYHREKWDIPYPESENQALADLITVSKKESIDFVYSISPGKSICYSDDSHFEKLILKLDQMIAQGVKSFAILLDDIDNIGFVHKKDLIKFNHDLALAHCYLTNRIYKALIKKVTNLHLIYCPTEYYQTGNSPYRETIAEELHSDIKVFWTGEGVFSKIIKKEFAKKIKTVFNHPMVLWDNYPVNDANSNCIFLGPVINRDPYLYQVSPDFFSNPMIEANLSKFTLTTVADYTWNPEAYDPGKSYLKAITLHADNNPESLKVFADTTLASRLFKGGNWELDHLIQNWFKDHLKLLEYLEQCKQHADNLLNSTILSRFRQLEPYLKEWEAELNISVFCLKRYDQLKKQIKLNMEDQRNLQKLNRVIDPMLISVCSGKLIKLLEQFKARLKVH